MRIKNLTKLVRQRATATHRRRRLRMELLEDRRLLASLTLSHTHPTIYEEGSPQPSPPPTGNRNYDTLTYSTTGVIIPVSAKLKIVGQVDSYGVSDPIHTINQNASPLTANYRDFSINPFDSTIYLTAFQDETILVSSIVPNSPPAEDVNDYANDQLTLTVEIVYLEQTGFDPNTGPIYEQRTLSQLVTTNIVDTDPPPTYKQVTLSTSDTNSTEPHAVHYLPGPPNNGTASFLTFPPEWIGNSIALTVSGTATFGSDYSLSVRSVPADTGLSLTGSGNSLTLFVPTGVSQVYFDVVPLGDIFEPGIGTPPLILEPAVETVTISVNSNNPVFAGSSNTFISVTGSATINITDVLEDLKIIAQRSTTEEYRNAAVYDAFNITPKVGGVLMRGSAYLRIDATAALAAIPGSDYSLWRRNGTILQINPVPNSPGFYETESFLIDDQASVFIDVHPVDDKTLEGDETIDVTLRAYEPLLSGPRDHGTATMIIQELYFKTEKEVDPTPDPDSQCNCPCSCASDVHLNKRDGSIELQDVTGQSQYLSPGQDSQLPALRIKLTVPSGKSTPTKIALVINTVIEDADSSGNLIGLGRKFYSKVYDVTIDGVDAEFGNMVTSDRYFYITIQPDLTGLLSATTYPASLKTGLNQGIANLEVLAHPLGFKASDDGTPPTTETMFSGWVGRHALLYTDRSLSGIASGHSPGSSLPGIDRAIPNATILVPKPVAAGQSAGAVQRETGFALFRADGSTAWFKNRLAPPDSLSTLSGNTLTKRDGSKSVFNSTGQLTQSKDPQGNTTNYGYDSQSRVISIIDPIGQVTSIVYFENNVAAGVTADKFLITTPDGQLNTYLFNRTNQTLTITHTDPDGTGSRQALVETWTFAAGLLVSRSFAAANGTGTPRNTSINYDDNAAGTGQARGTRRVLSFNTTDGGTTTIAKTALQEGLILNGATPAQYLDLTYDLAPRKTFRNETIVTDPRGGITIYTLGASGHVLSMLDAVQVARLYPGLNAAQIAALTPTATQLTLRDQLSYRYDIPAPARDTYGNITGQYLGLPNQTLSPDPDRIVNGSTTVSNGPRQRQTTAMSFTNGNRTSVTQPGLPAQATTYNETFDIPTQSFDEHGNPMLQTVDANGLVTSQQWQQSPSAWQRQTDQFDVNNDGIVNPLDSLLVLNFISANGVYTIPFPAPDTTNFYDVNGDGSVTVLDSLLVLNEATRRSNGQTSPPPSPIIMAQRTVTYTTPTSGLPKGLVAQERVVTGRASGDIITDYVYFNASSATSTQQIGKLRTKTVASGTAEAATTTYNYNTRGDLTQITDPLGRVTNFYYDALDRVTATLGPDPDGTGPLLGLGTRFDYDVFNNLIATEVINSYLEGTTLYVTATKSSTVYNGIDLPTAQYTQNPAITWYLSGTTPTQSTTKTAGTAFTSSALNTYLNGNSVIINTPLSATTNQGLITTNTYTVAGDLLTTIETATGATPSTRVTAYGYDLIGRVTSIVTPNPGSGLTTTTSDVRAGSGGYVTDMVYDNLGNLLSTTDPLGNVTSQTYDDLNRVTAQSRPSLTFGIPGPTTSYAYTQSRFGWTITSTNANNQVVTQKTDLFGRPLSVTGDTPTQTWTYWTDGSLASKTNAAGSSTNYDYTLRGQLKTTTDPAADNNTSSPVTTYTYYSDGQLKDVTDPLLRKTFYLYQTGGRLGTISTPDPDGAGSQLAAQTYFQYDAVGNVRKQTDSLLNATTYAYDSLFHPISTTDARGAITQTGYNLFGEVTSVTDPNNNVTQYLYNGVGNLITERQVISGVNRDRSYSYDGANNLRSATDRNNRVIESSYDNLYRKTQETWKTGATTNRTIAYTYDSLDNLITVNDTYANAPDFYFAYDDRNQLQLESQTIAGLNRVIINRDYDNHGNRTALSVNIGGSILAETTANPGTGGSISGGVNDLRNDYSYDRLNRLTSVAQSSNGGHAVAPKLATFTYDVASQMTDARKYSATSIDPAALVLHSRYAYDSASRLTSITHAKIEIASGLAWNGTSALPASNLVGNTVAAFAFTYDRDNRMLTMASYADRYTATYKNDPVDQVTEAKYTDIAGLAIRSPLIVDEAYNLDANGNRNTSSGVSQSAAGTYNRLQTDGTYNYTYDNEGNVTYRTRIDGTATTQYIWDHHNRLSRVWERTGSSTGPINQQTTYEYDAFDRRVMDYFDTNGDGVYDQIDRWFNDGNNRLLQIRDADGQGTAQVFRISNRYLHGDQVDRVISDEQFANNTGPIYSTANTTASTLTGTTLWSVVDQLGSARDLIDNTGLVRKHIVYDSFGKRLSETNGNLTAAAVDTAFGFTGADYDADTGLTEHGRRWYDANTGRWLSADPSGLGPDVNPYRYVGNGPTNATDPSGLEIIVTGTPKDGDISGMPWHLAHFPLSITKDGLSYTLGRTGWDYSINCEKRYNGKYWYIENINVKFEIYILIDPDQIEAANRFSPYDRDHTIDGVYGHEQLHVIQFKKWLADTGVPFLKDRNEKAGNRGELGPFETEKQCDTAFRKRNDAIRTYLNFEYSRLGTHYSREDPKAPHKGTDYPPYGDKPMPGKPTPYPGPKHPYPPLQK